MKSQRVKDAAAQLLRYNGEPFSEEIVRILEVLDNLNDDLFHGRESRFTLDNLNKIKELVAIIAKDEGLKPEKIDSDKTEGRVNFFIEYRNLSWQMREQYDDNGAYISWDDHLKIIDLKFNKLTNGFSHEDLDAVVEGLDCYEQKINVGGDSGFGDHHVESTTAYAARFIRNAMTLVEFKKEES